MKHIRMKAAVLQYIKKGIYMNEDLRVIVSIIVPVYKVEKYLSACIDSLLRQTYPYLQIILIDDGSPDRCPAICEDYAEKDERIQVVHQQNAGLSAARNTGMKVSFGKYILFVDSDSTKISFSTKISLLFNLKMTKNLLFSEQDEDFQRKMDAILAQGRAFRAQMDEALQKFE